MATVVIVVLYTLDLRLLDPVGEKFIPVIPPGGADFVFPFNGARALLLGVNPYIHDRAELFDPWHREEPIDGVTFRQFYPPSQLLLFVPLAWLTGGDFRTASRIWFHLNLLSLLGLSLVLRRLLQELLGADGVARDLRNACWLLMLFALAGNQGVGLALERGQTEIFGALLCWSAVLAWLRGKRLLAMFLAVGMSLLKGYGVLFAAGLGLLGLAYRPARRSVLGGAALAVSVLLLPVARYVPEALVALRFRGKAFWPVWYNHSFKNLAYNVTPAFADAAGAALAALALLGTAAAWWMLRQASRADVERPVTALWLVLFASASLATMTGALNLSLSYNLVLILPGVLLLALAQRRLREHAPLGSEAFVGSILCLLCFASFVFWVGSPAVPAAAFGVLGLPLLAGAAAVKSRLRA